MRGKVGANKPKAHSTSGPCPPPKKTKLPGLVVKKSWWRSGALLVGLTLLFYGASAGVAGAKPLVLTEKDSGRTVNVMVGQSLVVDLQLGAGQHVIAPEFNHEVLALVGQSLQSTTGPQGASSRIIYQFIVHQGGQTDLVVDVKGSGKKEDASKPLLKIKIVASGGGQSI